VTPVGTKLGGWDRPVVDADLHVNLGTVATIAPYLDPVWVDFVSETGFAAPPGPATLYPAGAATTVKPEWIPDDGVLPASTLALLREHVLDPLAVETAVLNCYWGVEAIRHPDFATGLARALNDWLIDEWLDKDDRLRASMVVPTGVPVEAAAEIDRVGGHPGFVQVLLPVRSPALYGQRNWHPMFAAIEQNDLVAGIHLGGNPDGPPTPTGWPQWFMEEHAGLTQVFQSQLISIIGEGLFEKFPSLRVSFLESGFTWLGPTLWRMDKEWKGLRRDVPWIKRLPSETIQEHIRFTTQPIDAGPIEDLAKALNWFDAERVLMFASDYPHDYGDDVSTLLRVMPKTSHEWVMAANAKTHYRL
jgi:predicted TIM-barrel fold metal-dependent hydrolase